MDDKPPDTGKAGAEADPVGKPGRPADHEIWLSFQADGADADGN